MWVHIRKPQLEIIVANKAYLALKFYVLPITLYIILFVKYKEIYLEAPMHMLFQAILTDNRWSVMHSVGHNDLSNHLKITLYDYCSV